MISRSLLSAVAFRLALALAAATVVVTGAAVRAQVGPAPLIAPLLGSRNYVPPAVTFSSTYMTRGADLTGDANGKVGIFSCWVKWNGSDGSVQVIFRSGTGFFEFRKETNNTVTVNGVNAAISQILLLTSSSTFTASATWHSFVSSWNLATGFGKLYIDGADATAGGATLTNDTIAYSQSNWSFGGSTSGALLANASVSDCYFNNATSLDITVAANLAAFIANGRPVDLGSTCQNPTGSTPIACFKGPASSWTTNLGTGGNFTVQSGSITNSATSP